jgi:ribulose-5-phosphate 4-epimerase/fuculose-1-phosphate aldolase
MAQPRSSGVSPLSVAQEAPLSIPSIRDRVAPEEWQTRVDLAACYRLVAREGWDDLTYAHISARIPGEEAFLLNPFGLFFEEITASSLVKVDFEGNILVEAPAAYNPGAYLTHRAIHLARPEVGCILHLHTPAGIAVSAQEKGLLPITQNALMFHGEIAYHAYDGLVVTEAECEKLAADLGDGRALMLRGHGTITVGKDVAQAYVFTHFLERACRMQVAALAGDMPVVEPDAEVQARVLEQVRDVFPGLGTMEWPGLMRRLDRSDPSFRD